MREPSKSSLKACSLFPLAARAQQPAMPVIGILGSTSVQAHHDSAFRKGLATH
jgi:hypothetical protein